MESAVFEGDDLVADAVEEIAIVGDDENAASEGGECFLKHA